MALGNELRGGDEFGRGADAVRGHLRMVLQDGLAMVFLENPSSKLESNAISESRGFTGLEQEVPLVLGTKKICFQIGPLTIWQISIGLLEC